MTAPLVSTMKLIPTNGTVKQSLADLLGAFINVKTRGAVGDGVTDDSDAIQAALDIVFPSFNAANSRGAVYFPPGKYKVTKVLNLNNAQGQGRIYGAGAAATSIIADFAGFVFDSALIPVATSTASTISGFTLTVGGTVTDTFTVGHELTGVGITYYTTIDVSLGGGQYTISKSHTISTPQAINTARRPTVYNGVIEGMTIYNSNTAANSGCIRYSGGASAILMSDLDIQGHIGIQMGGRGQTADTCFDSLVQKCRFNGLGGYPSYDTGGIGLVMGPETAALSCSFLGWDNGIRTYGAQQSISACRLESNNVGATFGMDVDGAAFQSSGCGYSKASVEGNTVDFYIYSSSGVTIEDVVTGGEVDGAHNSTYGIKINGGSLILIKNVGINGDYVTAGIGFVGGVDTTAPGVTFINVNTGAGSGGGAAFDFGPLTNQSSLEQIACKNFPTFSCSVAQLPSYASAGTRRIVTDSVDPVYDTSGTPKSNAGKLVTGSGSNIAPVQKDSAGTWRLG